MPNALPVHRFKNVNDALLWAHPAKRSKRGHECLYARLVPEFPGNGRDLLPRKYTLQFPSVQDEKPRLRVRLHAVLECREAGPSLNARTVSIHEVGSRQAG